MSLTTSWHPVELNSRDGQKQTHALAWERTRSVDDNSAIQGLFDLKEKLKGPG